MKKIYIPMIRFGDKEFDEGYIGWGFQSLDEQMRDAEGVLRIIGRRQLNILDLACGLGNYHRVWLEAGHTVTGTDLSETFITMATVTNPNAAYRVENYDDLDEADKYDLVTLIDTPVVDDHVPSGAFRALKQGGHFVFQVQNPLYPHARGPLLVNRRDWTENDDRSFLLTRHEYNEEIDRWEYEEWTLNLETREVVVQHNFERHLSFSRLTDILIAVGFSTVCFLDHRGRPLEDSDTETKNYFCLAYKSEA